MLFTETPIQGAYLLTPELLQDERGLFARTFSEEEFAAHGLHTHFPQCNTSQSPKKGTLRGMHYQAAPHQEVKIVRCTAGSIYDVVVDLRSDSRTFLQWHGETLSADNRCALYIPVGCAHGFLTLTDDSEVLYMMGHPYHPESARGVRWNDPALAIVWPGPVKVISERDAGYPDYKGINP